MPGATHFRRTKGTCLPLAGAVLLAGCAVVLIPILLCCSTWYERSININIKDAKNANAKTCIRKIPKGLFCILCFPGKCLVCTFEVMKAPRLRESEGEKLRNNNYDELVHIFKCLKIKTTTEHHHPQKTLGGSKKMVQIAQPPTRIHPPHVRTLHKHQGDLLWYTIQWRLW